MDKAKVARLENRLVDVKIAIDWIWDLYKGDMPKHVRKQSRMYLAQQRRLVRRANKAAGLDF